MIIGLIKKLLTFVTDTLFSVIDIPIIPSALSDMVSDVFGYMREGMGIINFFCPLERISPAIDFFVLIYAVVHGYKLVMWVLKKIPMLGIE